MVHMPRAHDHTAWRLDTGQASGQGAGVLRSPLHTVSLLRAFAHGDAGVWVVVDPYLDLHLLVWVATLDRLSERPHRCCLGFLRGAPADACRSQVVVRKAPQQRDVAGASIKADVEISRVHAGA
jgi:hypothetical protein